MTIKYQVQKHGIKVYYDVSSTKQAVIVSIPKYIKKGKDISSW